jgi:hypothetical protein
MKERHLGCLETAYLPGSSSRSQPANNYSEDCNYAVSGDLEVAGLPQRGDCRRQQKCPGTISGERKIHPDEWSYVYRDYHPAARERIRPSSVKRRNRQRRPQQTMHE